MVNICQHHQEFQSLSSFNLFSGIADVEQTEQLVGNVFRPHQLNIATFGKNFSAEMDHVAFTHTSLSRLHYKTAVQIASDPFDKFLLVMMPLKGSTEIRYGDQQATCTPARSSIIGASDDLSMRWSEECEQLILRIDKEIIESICEAQLGYSLKKPVEFKLDMEMSDADSFSWQHALSQLIANNAFLSNARKYPLISNQLEQLIVTTLLNSHAHNYRDELLSPAPKIAPYYVKRAEEFLEANAAQNISSADLARHIEVSTRAIQYGFQKYRNTTPMAFLKSIRLEKVRQTLLEKKLKQKSVSITDVALSWGFNHLGHFTEDYRKKFGELPSETLQKK